IYACGRQRLIFIRDRVNCEPFEGGCMFKIKASDEAQFAALVDATAYEALVEDKKLCAGWRCAYPAY
ncbi:hypothetical protein ACVGV7_04120, partial [Enterobacter intestinihominis]